MTPREYLMIECLLREPGTPVSRERLIGYAWPESSDTDPASVNTIVSRLRRKFARDLPQVRIDTVSYLGYRIVLASGNPLIEDRDARISTRIVTTRQAPE
ncbi:winged helix-turn-helix domain-containing protein [Burkholderia ambifaria]|uniref:Putative two component transcriptional regulator, winged helix family n=1 Tax=Burkholderia ambifaria MEX-5 TaxID=396597 RepID=B1T1H2_9BURK|nr:winged helix-turn-helix domain-containing protein [Burkholderia ambifaria]EDT42605.1 putative two component transcriptional regulator, winged helix family [Burkholderia ambifaria MEX-5]